MALANQGKMLAQYIEDNKRYTKRNIELFDIYQGNLLPYVQNILRTTLSEQYYSRIKSRIYPINILRRVIDKLSAAYATAPIRTANSATDTLEFYEKTLRMNMQMSNADEFAQLFKGYALEPYINKGVPQLRVIPYDRFLVMSDDLIDPTRMTHFFKYVGKKKRLINGREVDSDIWFVYTDEEFIIIDQEGKLVTEMMIDPLTGEQMDGTNPLGFIPFYYANRSEYSVMPVQDTDTLELAKLLPVQLTDLAGAIMFQCFSIVYGIDVDSENMTMSPNAFWSMKSDPTSDKAPQVGTIKPEVDVEKVLAFIKDTFSTWMETRGIRVGSIGSTDGTQSVSGISKIIDEMDTFEARKKAIEDFTIDEYRFWQLVKKMHNVWVANGELGGMGVLPENWEVFTEFDAPRPAMDRGTEVDVAIKERDAGVISQRTMIKKLYPNWSEEDIDKELAEMQGELV